MAQDIKAQDIKTQKILLLDGVDPICAQTFAERGIEADQPGKMSLEELKAILPQYAGVVVRSATTVDADLLESAPNLKVIGRAGVGVDNIDLPAATSRGILVMNTPDGNTISTAEHTCGLILSLARNIPVAVERVKSGGWDRKKFMGTEVYGKTLGVIGLGKIGSEVARRMSVFGMSIVAFDPFSTEEHAAGIGARLTDLDSLLGEADFLTVHTPLTEKTRGLISKKQSVKMKPGMRLVNCARGGIFEEGELLELLENGTVEAVALDVYSQEPPPESLLELLKHPKVVCTPHLGASTEEAQEKVALQIADQMADALENKGYKGSLNAKSIALLTDKDAGPYLELAEKLGRVAGQLTPQNAADFSFEYAGKCSRYAAILTDAILKGMLSQHVSTSVNLINARYFATERGYKLRETTSGQGDKNYTDLVTIRVGDSTHYQQISGAVFGPGDYRIVEIDGFNLELRMEGDILLYQNEDKPGMLASVAGALAKNQVNIGALSLGRESKGTNAITAVVIDKKLDDAQLGEIRALDGVRNVRYVSLGS